MSVNFTKYQDEISRAWRKVVDSTSTQNWALFGYEGSTNIIKLTSTGCGLDELVQEFNCSSIQYAFCRVIDQQSSVNKLILINWQGDSAPLSRKGLCASHVGEVTNYFRGCAQTITIRNDDEATKEFLIDKIVKTSSSRITLPRSDKHPTSNHTNDISNSSAPSHANINITSEIAADRKSFWERQEEEERQRIAEEKKRAAEKQAQFEQERKQREQLEAKKLAETIKERERLIEANKKSEKIRTSQPSSMLSDPDAEENRVGRRSELIRLERNQETQSLISKGLIKNKRAIFEQAQQQQQQAQQQTLSRKSSGAMVAQRMNVFKSLDNAISTSSPKAADGTSPSTVNKLAESFSDTVGLGGDSDPRIGSPPKSIPKEIKTVILTKGQETQTPNSELVSSSVVIESNLDEPSEHHVDTSPALEESRETTSTDGAEVSQDVNGNSDANLSKKSADETEISEVVSNEQLIMNGKNSNISAIALFDYQAADNTEISFDPDDKISHIQKVDPGWWHGLVMTGRFKGQVGLFPANYVQETKF